jgi:glyoxylase-like metal-dependent hydrolase (beta-lactamase superfamily II)
LQKQVASQPGRAGAAPPPEQVYADRTFTDTWREQLGDEWISCKFYGRAHTSGDITITFERANVVHMGDLMFNRRHPVVDRPAGALMKNHISVLEAVAKDHNNDTIYIFGHAGISLDPRRPPRRHRFRFPSRAACRTDVLPRLPDGACSRTCRD